MGTRITTKGQVTIPQDVRRIAGMEPGTELNWRYDPIKRALIGTRSDDPGRDDPDRFERLRGLLRGRMTTDEILAWTRGEPDE
jgi:bifunctional DNA-binding transcriptional regulator/antitoxin component of YhaV-PrlF toxin-antitoxin module